MQERWRRQDEAARLLDRIPQVASLSIEVEESDTKDDLPPTSHIRLVPMDSAPALFEIPCSDRECSGGVFDITHEVIDALQAGQHRFEGTQDCNGTAHDAPCPRKVHYVGFARYRDTSARADRPRVAEGSSA